MLYICLSYVNCMYVYLFCCFIVRMYTYTCIWLRIHSAWSSRAGRVRGGRKTLSGRKIGGASISDAPKAKPWIWERRRGPDRAETKFGCILGVSEGEAV